MWGDYGFSAKDKRVVQLKRKDGSEAKAKPMFVQFILEPLWKVGERWGVGREGLGVDKATSNVMDAIARMSEGFKEQRLQVCSHSHFRPVRFSHADPPLSTAALQAYTVLDGEDVGAVLSAIVKGRGLGVLVAPRALEHPVPKEALRVRGKKVVKGGGAGCR